MSKRQVTTKPWQLKRWRTERANRLKERCEICGKGQEDGKTLVLHHPAELAKTKRISEGVLLSQWFHESLAKGTLRPATERKLTCPRGHTNVKFAIKRNAYVCYSCHTQRVSPCPRGCTNEYGCSYCNQYPEVIPEEREVVTREGRSAAFRIFAKEYWEQAKAVRNQYNQKANETYMSLEGTVTLCKGCHLMLHKGLILCIICRKHWHRPRFRTCFSCKSVADER